MSLNLELILQEIADLPPWDTQIMLQGIKNQTDPFYGCGKLESTNHREQDFCYPLWTMPYTNSIIQQFKLYRTRVMRLRSKTCYSYHRDWTKRFHIPLITNDKCMFIIDDQIYRYPADGSWYLIDTTLRHTAINASWEDRIHIVGCLDDQF